MTREINYNRVNEAAMKHNSGLPLMGTIAQGNLIKDAFIAGAAWQAEQPLAMSSVPGRLVPRMPTMTDATGFQAVMAMLEQIEKRMCRMFDNVVKMIDNNVSDQGGRHKAVMGAMVETQSIIQDVGQKVEAVLDQVTEPEVINEAAAEPSDREKLRSAMVGMGLDADKFLRPDHHG